jgi:hypothetical protein
MIMPPWLGTIVVALLSLEDVDVGSMDCKPSPFCNLICSDRFLAGRMDLWTKIMVVYGRRGRTFCVEGTIFQTIAPFRSFVG